MDPREAWRMALPPVAGFVFAALVFLHTPGVNGPSYWKWPWRRNPRAAAVATVLGLAAVPALCAQIVRDRSPERRRLIATLLVFSSLALPLGGSAFHAGSTPVQWIRRVMLDPSVTGFLGSALEIVEFEHRRPDVDWLRNYDKIMPYFPLHARTKPFGLVVAHYLSLREFGPNATISIAAAVAALCATLSVIMMLAGFRWMGFGDAIATDAATLLALTPSMTIFFPLPDVAYPLLTVTAMASWWRALFRRDLFAAAGAALVIFIASITSFGLLAIGIPLLLMTIWRIVETRSLNSLIAPLATAGAVFFGAYALLYAMTGYPPIASFRSAMAAQRWLLARLHRPYPQSIPFDFLDFCLGLGWVTVILALMWLARFRTTPRSDRFLAIAALATPVLVAATGQLQAETARVWIFLMPLVAFPAALELSRWPLKQRLAACVALVVVTIALYSNMDFIVAS